MHGDRLGSVLRILERIASEGDTPEVKSAARAGLNAKAADGLQSLVGPMPFGVALRNELLAALSDVWNASD